MPDPHRSTRAVVAIALAAPLLVAAAAPAAAQQAGERGYTERVRLENERVRVVELHYAPGSAAPLHTHHFPRVVYVVESGVLELRSAAGESLRVELAPGQTLWRPAETHAVRNVGPTQVRVVETEVKAAPPDPAPHG